MNSPQPFTAEEIATMMEFTSRMRTEMPAITRMFMFMAGRKMV